MIYAGRAIVEQRPEVRQRVEAEHRDASDPRLELERKDLAAPRPWFHFYSERDRSWRVHDAKGCLVVSRLSERDAKDIAKAGV